MQKYAANIWKLKVFNVIDDFLLILPIITIFWLESGLSMAEVFILQSIFAFVILILEVPSGYFADKFGRKTSLVLGITFLFFGYSAYAFSYNFWQFALTEVLLGVSRSFISGADSAMLYDTLVQLKRKNEYKKIEGSIMALMSYGAALAGIIGGLIAAYSLRGVFYVQMVILFFAIPLALSLKEPRKHAFENPEEPTKMRKIVKYSLFENKKLRWTILYASFVLASTLTMVWFVQPFWKSVNIPIFLFGVLWATWNICRGLFAGLSYKYESFLGQKKALFSLILFPFLGFLFLAIFSKQTWSIIFLLFFPLTFGLSYPVLKDYVNKLVSSNIRATVLSVQSLVSRAVFGIIGPFLGWALDLYSFQIAFLISGGVFFVGGGICLIFLRKTK